MILPLEKFSFQSDSPNPSQLDMGALHKLTPLLDYISEGVRYVCL